MLWPGFAASALAGLAITAAVIEARSATPIIFFNMKISLITQNGYDRSLN
jgi:hypothetical protein